MEYTNEMLECDLSRGCNLIKRDLKDKQIVSDILKKNSGFGKCNGKKCFWAYVDLADPKYDSKNFNFGYLFDHWKKFGEEQYRDIVCKYNGEVFRCLLDCDVLKQVIEQTNCDEKLKQKLLKEIEHKELSALKFVKKRPEKGCYTDFPIGILSDDFSGTLRKVQEICSCRININIDNADKLSKFQKIALLPFLDMRANVKANVAHSGSWAVYCDLNGNLYQNVHDFHMIDFCGEMEKLK